MVHYFWHKYRQVLNFLNGKNKKCCTRPVASFAKEVNPPLAKRPLIFNGHLANRGLTSLVKEATGVQFGTEWSVCDRFL